MLHQSTPFLTHPERARNAYPKNETLGRAGCGGCPIIGIILTAEDATLTSESMRPSELLENFLLHAASARIEVAKKYIENLNFGRRGRCADPLAENMGRGACRPGRSSSTQIARTRGPISANSYLVYCVAVGKNRRAAL